jgi:hypothetical protein
MSRSYTSLPPSASMACSGTALPLPKENARKQTATENFRLGTRGNAKKGKTQREMDIDRVRRSMTNRGLTEEDTRDRDRWRNLILGEGKPL